MSKEWSDHPGLKESLESRCHAQYKLQRADMHWGLQDTLDIQYSNSSTMQLSHAYAPHDLKDMQCTCNAIQCQSTSSMSALS